VLWKDGNQGREEKLVPSFPSWAMTGLIRSQWAFKASPDGTHLAFLTPESGALHVRDRFGHELLLEGVKSNDWRFSADGRRVAAIIGEGYERSIVVLDLSSGTKRELGRTTIPDHLEWTEHGVVIRDLHELDRRRDWRNLHRLVYYPLEGPSRTLVERKGIRQFATASNGTRVIFFDVGRDGWAEMAEVSVDRAGSPVALGKLRHVLDAEIAPEGSRAAVVTDKGVFLLEGKRLRRVSRDEKVSTLWFSSDGTRLMFATPRAVTLLVGGQEKKLEAKGQVFASARFVSGGPDVLIAGSHTVLRWKPDDATPQAMVAGREGEAILAADVLGPDVVVWTQQPVGSGAL
jgi:hypothetical protein